MNDSEGVRLTRTDSLRDSSENILGYACDQKRFKHLLKVRVFLRFWIECRTGCLPGLVSSRQALNNGAHQGLNRSHLPAKGASYGEHQLHLRTFD